MAMNTILSEDVGYFVLLGVELFMAQVVTFIVKAESKWLGTRETSEWFYGAGRNIRTGLIASSDRINCNVSCIGLDLGGYLVRFIHHCISIWNKWSILVRCKSKYSSSSNCNISYRIKMKDTVLLTHSWNS